MSEATVIIKGVVFRIDIKNKLLICIIDPKIKRKITEDAMDHFRSIVSVY